MRRPRLSSARAAATYEIDAGTESPTKVTRGCADARRAGRGTASSRDGCERGRTERAPQSGAASRASSPTTLAAGSPFSARQR